MLSVKFNQHAGKVGRDIGQALNHLDAAFTVDFVELCQSTLPTQVAVAAVRLIVCIGYRLSFFSGLCPVMKDASSGFLSRGST